MMRKYGKLYIQKKALTKLKLDFIPGDGETCRVRTIDIQKNNFGAWGICLVFSNKKKATKYCGKDGFITVEAVFNRGDQS